MDKTRKRIERSKSKSVNKFEITQKAELASWICEDPIIRADKAVREAIRYPLIKKQMGLDYLDTSQMEIWDIGCGAIGGVSTILNGRKILRIDSLANKYAKYYPLTNYETAKAEDLKERLRIPDLIIVTNALDHLDRPNDFLDDLAKYMHQGAFFGHLHAINNAFSHPHDGHVHNVNPELFKEKLGVDFECVWYQDFQHDGLTYGWRHQPAFTGLYRKVTDYK